MEPSPRAALVVVIRRRGSGSPDGAARRTPVHHPVDPRFNQSLLSVS
ncbi:MULTISPECIES: hypothetical protein [Streptomyces]|uniref:Uncharacterized protein n=1 Tax=Streptomyces eurythermus TaxID=42237 RepID=A0ABW6Z7I8_9ACTN|nr:MULTISPECIES: hypothetical protein [Streptomyces]QIS70810.1 hypothetical protein HB370_12970 [Streptomyces sp. DSM 40868]